MYINHTHTQGQSSEKEYSEFHSFITTVNPTMASLPNHNNRLPIKEIKRKNAVFL